MSRRRNYLKLAGIAAASAIVVLATFYLLRLGPSATTSTRSPAAVATGEAVASEANDEPVDWDHPFIDGLEVPTLAEAARHVPFGPVMPPALAGLRSIVVHRAVWPIRERAVAFVYQTPSYGRLFAIESPPVMTEAELEAMAAGCLPQRGCEGSWTMINLTNTARALLIAGPVTTSILWVRNGILFNVYGPAETFAPTEAAAVAARFLASS
jgi:hypothetical protein